MDGARRPARILVEARYLLWAAALIVASALGAGTWSDWHFYHRGAQLLFSGSGLHLYADHPIIQIGPVSLAVARFLDLVAGGHAEAVARILFTASALLVLYLLEQRASRVASWTWLLGGVLLCLVWPQASLHVQFGDCLTIVFLAAAVMFVREGRPTAAGLALGLAVAAKPWALPMLPLMLAFHHRARLRALGATLGVIAIAYVPFFIADPGTIHAGNAPLIPMPDTLISLLGYSVPPWWVRPAQLALGLLLGYLVVRRGQWQAVLLAGVVARIALDPGDMPYYQAGLVAGAIAWDVDGDHRPVATLLAFAFFLPSGRHYTVIAVVRLALLIAAVVWFVVCPRPRTTQASATEPAPHELVGQATS